MVRALVIMKMSWVEAQSGPFLTSLSYLEHGILSTLLKFWFDPIMDSACLKKNLKACVIIESK